VNVQFVYFLPYFSPPLSPSLTFLPPSLPPSLLSPPLSPPHLLSSWAGTLCRAATFTLRCCPFVPTSTRLPCSPAHHLGRYPSWKEEQYKETRPRTADPSTSSADTMSCVEVCVCVCGGGGEEVVDYCILTLLFVGKILPYYRNSRFTTSLPAGYLVEDSTKSPREKISRLLTQNSLRTCHSLPLIQGKMCCRE